MATTTIDAALVQKMFLAGAKNLESKKEWINVQFAKKVLTLVMQ